MQLEDLCKCSGPELKALTDEQLESILKPYYNVTRPELAEKPSRRESVSKPAQQVLLDPRKRKALEMLAEEGMDLSFLKHKKK